MRLAAHARLVADRLVEGGLVPGGRVGLLVPSSADCLAAAYDEIKGRTGRMEGGVFIKDQP